MLFQELSGLLEQMPPALIANVCTAGILLIGAMVYFAGIKPSRRRRRESREQQAAAVEPYAGGSTSVDEFNDMPDLDLLTGSEPPPLDVTEPAAAAPASPPPIPVRQDGEYRISLSSGHATQAVEVLAILRDTVDDRLIVHLDSTGYRTLVDDPDVKKRFSIIMKELAETISTPDDAPQREPEPVADTIEPTPDDGTDSDDLAGPDLDEITPEQPAATQTPPTAPPSAPPSVPPPPPPAGDGAMPGDLPNYGEIKEEYKPRGFLRPPKIEAEPVPEVNIAAAIEAYLQHKLRHSDDYAGRDIHVRPAVHGGVVIQVDDRFYDAVDEIEDPDVRAFISGAIQEWQERQ